MNTERKPSIEEQALAFGMGIPVDELMDMMGHDYCSINDALSALRHYHEFTPISPSPQVTDELQRFIDAKNEPEPPTFTSTNYPIKQVTDEEIGQIFENKSDCYVEPIDDSVIPAMTKQRFIEVVRDLLTKKL